MIADALEHEIIALSGELRTNMLPVQIERRSNQYAVELADGSLVEAEHLVSTIPLNALQRLLQIAPTHTLDYRGLICIFLALDQAQVSSDSWTYFPDRELIFGRIHEPQN